MFDGHFYHETVRRTVSVFGTLFNNISVLRKDSADNVLNIVKVPLAYGPKQKFLARIDQQESLTDPKVGIKLPRMSFELTTLSYDNATKMQRGSRHKIPTVDGSHASVLGPVGYRLGIQLSIMAKNQDDALQVLEQVLPFFQPDYTVTVKQVEDNFKADMPFTLQSISMGDDYEGDYLTRRAIIYTLDFETRIRFYGPITNSAVIRRTSIDFINQNTSQLQERQLVILNPFDAESKEDYTVDVNYSLTSTPDSIVLTVTDGSLYPLNSIVYGSVTNTSGQVITVSTNTVTIYKPDGIFQIGELLVTQDGLQSSSILTQSEVYDE